MFGCYLPGIFETGDRRIIESRDDGHHAVEVIQFIAFLTQYRLMRLVVQANSLRFLCHPTNIWFQCIETTYISNLDKSCNCHYPHSPFLLGENH